MFPNRFTFKRKVYELLFNEMVERAVCWNRTVLTLEPPLHGRDTGAAVIMTSRNIKTIKYGPLPKKARIDAGTVCYWNIYLRDVIIVFLIFNVFIIGRYNFFLHWLTIFLCNRSYWVLDMNILFYIAFILLWCRKVKPVRCNNK